MRESGQNPGRLELVFRDQSEERRTEAALREAEERFRSFFDNAPVGKSMTAPDGRLLQVNAAFGAMLGYSPDEMQAVSFAAITHPDDVAESRECIRALLAGERNAWDMEKRYRAKDGRYVWTRVTSRLQRDDHGQPRHFVTHIQDVSAQKAAEQELLEGRRSLEQRIATRTAELQWSKELLDATGELARVGGWEIDLERNELSWTEAVYKIHEIGLDYRPTVDAGINFYAPDAVPVISEAVRRAIDEGQPFDLELQLITAKRNRIWVRAIGEAIRRDGRVVKVRGVFQDIHQQKLTALELEKHREHLEELVAQRTAKLEESERRLVEARDELERRVRDRTAQLEESNHELEAFSYSVSHDLRAPLRAIGGFTRILTDDYAPQLDSEGQRLCSIVRQNAGKMGRLIDDLLAFSRLGRAEMCLSPVDMGTMASSVFHELTTPESRARIDFRVGTVPPAVADPTLMRQVWMNLLSNAIKFSSKRERALITVAGHQDAGEIVYAVQDNGAGFDMQYVGKLFGVSQRLHNARDFEGTGVGLALVQRVIRRHGGRVWAQGETDRGATFNFAFEARGD